MGHEECKTLQDRLIFSLCHTHEMDSKPEQFAESLFDRLFEIARISNFNAEELAEYEANRMNMLDYNASMKFARKEGFARGEARGEAKGILRTARKMKAEGIGNGLISRITGLSEAEIQRLG